MLTAYVTFIFIASAFYNAVSKTIINQN